MDWWWFAQLLGLSFVFMVLGFGFGLLFAANRLPHWLASRSVSELDWIMREALMVAERRYRRRNRVPGRHEQKEEDPGLILSRLRDGAYAGTARFTVALRGLALPQRSAPPDAAGRRR